MNSRRDFIRKSLLFTAGSVIASSAIGRMLEETYEVSAPDGGKYSLPQLPYSYDALEPHIDKQTMEIHHGKHHAAYVKNLNDALEKISSSDLPSHDLATIFKHVPKLPAAIRNNAGGHYNHMLFWSMMHAAPEGKNEPTGKLGEAIVKEFGSVEEFRKKFAEAAMKRFGSGWAWLVKTDDGKLAITSTANQDSPLMLLESIEVKGKPVLALDVWEHAYYLKNQNRRNEYIESWWKVVNWKACDDLFAAV